MKIRIEKAGNDDLDGMISIWNEVVRAGEAFPQEEMLERDSGRDFFTAQTRCAVARDVDSGAILGMYILHPNNVGRCGHICNASYAVNGKARGMGIGEALVKDSLVEGKKAGFKIMQFNAVVADNAAAHKLYHKLGFEKLGLIPGGFNRGDGIYKDIILYFKIL